MSCSCVINDYYDGEFVTMLSEATRKARKGHKCSECGRIIQKGESYKYETFAWDGSVSTSKTCADCMSIRKEFFCTYNFGELLFELWERINEEGCGEEFLTSQVQKLTPAARETLFEMIEQCWGDENG